MGKVKDMVTEVEGKNRVSCEEAMRILAGVLAEKVDITSEEAEVMIRERMKQEAELHEQAKDFINADRGDK